MPSWDTKDEINYIMQIGRAAGLLGAYTRLQLLENYFEAAIRREAWAGLDGARIIAVCIAQIERERGPDKVTLAPPPL